MTLVVLGAGGQLGGAVVAAARAAGHDVLAWTRRDADITRPDALAERLTAARPSAVFNCAAWARVDEAEHDPVTVFQVNAWAVRDLARLSQRLGFTLVHYSTDFVFDGAGPGPYVETDTPHPRGVYATSKLVGEWMAADAPRHFVLRVESLFGGAHGKSSIDVMLARLRAGASVKAFSDRTVSPSSVADVAAASLALVAGTAPSGLYHCVNSGQTTWADMALTLASLAGVPADRVEPVRMADQVLAVPRPLRAALSNRKLADAGVSMPDWRTALARLAAGA